MRYRRTRIPGTGPPAPPQMVLYALPEAELHVTPDGRVARGADASALNRELRNANVVLRPVFGERDRLRARAGTCVRGAPCHAPDLSTYYRIMPTTGVGFPEEPSTLNALLRTYDAVAAAYIRPPTVLPVLPSTVVPPHLLPVAGSSGPTKDFSNLQGYLSPARTGGIDARFAWTMDGGSGEGVRVVDIERAWCMTHEDLDMAADDLMGGTPTTDPEARNHGTAVIGILASTHDGSGVMGISPGADVKGMAVSADGVWDLAVAIRNAADRLSPGDIILIEQMAPGPNVSEDNDDPQKGYIPVEWWPLEGAAIQYAASRGIIVVEPAGNGTEDLDDPVYERGAEAFGPPWKNPLRLGGRDTGAILVGAGAPPPGTHGEDFGVDCSRLPFSNWGSRVDVQGWGREVTTTGGIGGGPDKLRPDWDENRWYTNRFSGTSSAAPIVAGALACVQGMLRAAGREPLTPTEARDLLRSTGSPQRSTPGRPARQRIGPRPDLRSIVERVFDQASPLGGAKARRRSHDMTKVTITVESDGGVTVDQDDKPESLAQALRAVFLDPQRKGPALILPTADGGERRIELGDFLGAGGS
jgi:hypothetical protein